jgi:predicted permease
MLHDLKFALRNLSRNRGFAALAASTLGLGIALVATQYSLIDGVLLRPLPFRDADRIVHVSRAEDRPGAGLWSPVKMEEWHAIRDQQQSFEKLAAFQFGTFNVTHEGAAPRRLIGNSVSAQFFEVVGTVPVLGRGFGPGEDAPGQPALIVLSDKLWQEEFGGAADIVGRQFNVNGETATVIGVAPPGFQFPGRDDCWLNLRAAPAAPGADYVPRVELVGLLKPDVAAGAAATETSAILGRVQQAAGVTNEPMPRARVLPVPDAYSGTGNWALFMSMLGMTVFVLLLACVNVANLLFVRAEERMRELALRNALGAGAGRLVRQLLVEAMVLAGLGTAVGVALAWAGVRALDLATHSMLELPIWMRFDLNPRVLLFTIAVSVLAGLLAGLAPALRAGRVELNAALREDGGGSVGARGGRLGRWLMAGQLAFACGAMITASLLALSAVRQSRVTLEFDPGSILIGRIELQAPAYDTPQDRSQFYERLLERVRALPGVASTAVSSRDLVNSGVYGAVEIDGVTYAREADRPSAWLEVVTRDYFGVVDRGALSGRLFGKEDGADTQPVALVNRSFAEQTWPGLDPLGRRIRRGEGDTKWATVVGVVPDLHMQGVGNGDSGPGYYLLQDQMGWGWLDLLVRVEGDPAALIGAVRAAVAEVDPKLPIHTIGTLAERTKRATGGLRILGGMTVVFALAALLLSAIGVYGVMAFAARKRMREFGVRVALGSTGGRILTLLLRLSAPQTVIGIGVGLLLGFALARPLQPALSGVSVSDPAVYLVVALVLGVTALLACCVPALRAARVDPVVALRAG